MKINLDRLCELAGVNNGTGHGNLLNEASNRTYYDDPQYAEESEYRYGSNQLSEKRQQDVEESVPLMTRAAASAVGSFVGSQMADRLGEDEEQADEIVEIDEAELVSELRRAKRLMRESRENRRRNMQEARFMKQIIEEEVADALADLNLNSSWVYGNNKPRNSRRGTVATAFPGIGFRK